MVVRERLFTPANGPDDGESVPVWLRALLCAFGAAAVSVTGLAVVAVVAWLAAGGVSTGMVDAARIGVNAWLLAHGVPLRVTHGVVSLVPWLLTLWPLGTLWWAARRLCRDLPADGQGRHGARRAYAVGAVAFAGGYVVIAVLLGLLARHAAAAAALIPGVLGPAVLALLAYALALRGRLRRLGDTAPVVGVWSRLPTYVRVSIGPAILGLVGLGAAGLLGAVAVVAAGFPRVLGLAEVVGAGAVGAAVLGLVQLCYLPTLAMWAVAFAAGPGFGVGAGSSVAWGHAEPGVLPLVPVLGALPDPGSLPGWLAATVVVPVLVGAGVGAGCLRALGEPASLLDRVRTAACGAALVALFATLATALASGSLGGGRLAHVGPAALPVGAALLGELLAGALLTALLSSLRLRRFGAHA